MHMHLTPLPHSEDYSFMFASTGQTNLGLTEPSETLQVTDTLDDVFGSDNVQNGRPNTDPSAAAHRADYHSHPSDIRRLQSEHTTAGYREGVTVAKVASVQAGFDEGFGLGATLGLSAGEIIGVLEGLAAAVPADGRLSTLLNEARDDLSARSIFGAAYWATDGTWTYLVPGQDGSDVIFRDVVEAHPLIAKWRLLLNEENYRWGVRQNPFAEDESVDNEFESQRRTETPAMTPKATTGTAPATQSRMSDALQW